MNHKPKCVIVTGRPGAGKSTLAKKLGEKLSMPVISRDEIKEGYVNSFGVKHDALPADSNGIVSKFFFDLVCQYLAGKVSMIIEAAFQHHVWEARMPQILELGQPFLIVCALDAKLAAQRHLQRGLADAKREWYHGDARVALYRATGEIAPPSQYVAPHFDVPTIEVATENDYAPRLERIVAQIRALN